MLKRSQKLRRRGARGQTSTLEILGLSTRFGEVPAKWAEHHRRLIALRDFFLGARENGTEIAREGISASGEHMSDAASDSFDRDCALALLSSAQHALYEIDQALQRIRAGTYGICEMTGKPIEAARLKAIPWARFCTAAQARLEAQGTAGLVRLGVLGSCAYKPTGPGESVTEEEDSVAEPEAEKEAA